LTHQYKDIQYYLQRCDQCNEPIDKFNDLKNIPIDIEKINEIVKRRTECNEIYKKMEK